MRAEPAEFEARAFEREDDGPRGVKQAARDEPRHLRGGHSAPERHDEKGGEPAHRDVNRARKPHRGLHPENLYEKARRGDAPDERKHHIPGGRAEPQDADGRVCPGDEQENRHVVEPLHKGRRARVNGAAPVIERARTVKQHHARAEDGDRDDGADSFAAAPGVVGELRKPDGREQRPCKVRHRTRYLALILRLFFPVFRKNQTLRSNIREYYNAAQTPARRGKTRKNVERQNGPDSPIFRRPRPFHTPLIFLLQLHVLSQSLFLCELERFFACHEVEHRYAGCVEYCDFFGRGAARGFSGDYVAELARYVFFGDGALCGGEFELAASQALRRVVGEDARAREDFRLYLLFAGHVSADAAEVQAGLHPFFFDYRRARGRDGYRDVAFGERRGCVLRRFEGDGRCVYSEVMREALAASRGEAARVFCVERVGYADGVDFRHEQQRGGNLEHRLAARAEYKEPVRFGPREKARAERARRAGPHAGDEGGVHDALRYAGLRVEYHEDTGKYRQAAPRVAGEAVEHLEAVYVFAEDAA